MLGQYSKQLKLNLLRKPKFLLKVMRHYLANICFPKKTSLRSMIVMLNTECNLRCEHCFAQSFAQDKKHRSVLTLGEMKAAFNEMINNGVYHFALQGGEVFLHPNLDELIKACQPNSSYITLVTNGTRVDEARLREIYKLGVNKIAVSIDSFFPEEHDKFRGRKGAHESAMRTLRLARKIGLNTSITTTVMNETLHAPSIQKILNYAIKNKIEVDINIPQPVGNWDGREDLILTDENFKYINNLHKKNVLIRRDLYKHIGRSGCPAVKESLYMNVFGDIFPCVYMHISIGNIKESSLKDIRNNALSVSEFAEYTPKCLAGEDREFLKKYVSKGYGVPKPADGIKIFDLTPPLKRNNELTEL